MKRFKAAIIFAAIFAVSGTAGAQSVMIIGQTAGPTPFISQLQLTANPPDSIASIKFQISPKPGSVTRPVTATYPSAYLQKNGYYNSQTGAILLPVFGLYANYNNTVTLTYSFTDNSSQEATLMIATPTYSDPCGHTNPTVVQARTNSTSLSYDFILLKHLCGTFSPTIIDTDGEVRWAGPTGFGSFSSILFQNSFYIGHGPILYRMEFDGTIVALRDYSSNGVTTFHHNIDFGKRGIIADLDTTTQIGATNMEVDGLGNILKTWDMAAIITNVMIAGGDNPSQFVMSTPNDWFHNNSVTYKRSDDSVLISSRENFIIALDYATDAIKWIFGDTTKQWHQFPSLAQYTLSLDVDTLAPIGEHALSITSDDNLLMFDNGKSSLNHSPAGADRTYSAPRKYHINTQAMVATELWNYENSQASYSPFCSSIYEDSPLNYVIDYAYLGTDPDYLVEVLGLDALGTKIFHYRYPSANMCDTGWNAPPVHLEDMVFTTLVPPNAVSRMSHGAAGTFDIPLPLSGDLGVECRSGGAGGDFQVVVTFAVPVTITGVNMVPGNGGTGSVSGTPTVSGNEVTVNLTNVSNAQKITVNLIGVNDGSNTENVSVPMGVLLGDTTADQSVSSTDVSDVKAQSGMAVTAATFRRDVLANGSVNATDVSTVKLASGTAIPQDDKPAKADKRSAAAPR